MIKSTFNLKGINYWLLGSAIGSNFFWVILILFLASLFSSIPEAYSVFTQVGLILACFGGPFLVGWVVSKIAGDRKALSYCVIGSFGGILPLLVFVLPAGLFGLILAITALLGGFNGGLLYLKQMSSNH
jgi:hypothetical protein